MAYAQVSTCYPQSFYIRILCGICASEHMLPAKFWYQDITRHMRKWAHFTSKVLISVYYAAYAQVSTCYLKSFSIRIFCGICASEHMLPAKFLISAYCTTRYCVSVYMRKWALVTRKVCNIMILRGICASEHVRHIFTHKVFNIRRLRYICAAQCARDLM